MITVLTPTFNRSDLLKRLFVSLTKQTEQKFEWLIVDDGSTDSTENVVNEFTENCSFTIRYVYKENGGKHSALNVGFDGADGDWIFIVDSDDWLKDDCIETIKSLIESVDDSTGSISMLRTFDDGQIIGEEFPAFLENYLDRIHHNVVGDKGDVFRKSALSNFHFPVFSGENFLAESPLFIWMGLNFKTYFINYPGYICEYQEGGLSAGSTLNRHKSFKSSLYVYHYQYIYLKSKKLKFKAGVNWWRFRIGKKYTCKYTKIPFMYSVIGIVFFIKDYLKYRNSIFK